MSVYLSLPLHTNTVISHTNIITVYILNMQATRTSGRITLRTLTNMRIKNLINIPTQVLILVKLINSITTLESPHHTGNFLTLCYYKTYEVEPKLQHIVVYIGNCKEHGNHMTRVKSCLRQQGTHKTTSNNLVY